MQISKRVLSVGRMFTLLVVLGATSWGFTQRKANAADELRYSPKGFPVNAQTAARWESSERDVAAEGAKLIPIAVDSKNASRMLLPIDMPARLKSLQPSERHGAGETRLLTVNSTDKTGKVSFQSSGILATVTLVNGSEYKTEADFQKGWVPLAIVVVADTFPSESIVYPKLKLRGGTSWLYAHEDASSHWSGTLVRMVGDKIEQDIVPLEAMANDKLEPVAGARFLWDVGHEDIWVYCGGKCCKMHIGDGPPPQ